MNRHTHLKSLPLSEAYWFQEGPGVRKWQFTDSGIKLLNVGNIEKDGRLNLEKTDRHLSKEEVAQKYSHFLVDKGDLVIASSGISFDDDGLLRTRGAFVENHQLPLCLNTSTIRFKAVEGISELSFLRFWLDSREFRSQITKLVTGSAQQNFGPSHLKAIRIKLPPIAEQKRIAEILGRTQSLISKRKEAIAKLDILTQSIFIEMFGDPESILNLWTTQKLGSLLEFLTSGSRGWASYYAESGDLFLRIQNVRWDELVLDDIAFVKAPISAEATRTKVKAGDVLLSITADLGRTAVVPEGISTAYINQHLAILRPKSIQSRFLSAYFASPSGRRQVQGRNQQGVKAGLNFDAIRSFLIPCPLFHYKKNLLNESKP